MSMIKEGTDAELIAMRAGVRDEMVKRSFAKKHSKHGTVISTTAICDGVFVTLNRTEGNAMEWLAVNDPRAVSLGIQYAADQLSRDKSAVKTPICITTIKEGAQ